MIAHTTPSIRSTQPASLRAVQLAWLSAAVFVVSAGYGALMPLLPNWMTSMLPDATDSEIARHVGFLSGLYSVGVLFGAPLWGIIADRIGAGRVLIIGLIGYVISMLLMIVPAFATLWAIYALRGTTGFFVAAVVPVVLALVASHTPKAQRARRFAWLGTISLLGFLFGPGLNALADWVGSLASQGALDSLRLAQVVIVLSALLGAIMMLGLAITLPKSYVPIDATHNNSMHPIEGNTAAQWCLSGVVMFVLAGFELGIVLQGQQHTNLSTRQVAMMFAECSLVMLGVNILLFFTALMEKASTRKLLGAGLISAMIGLAVLDRHHTEALMYLGISLTSAGTGIVLPVITYLAAGTTKRLGITMGGLAAAASIGQALGSTVVGWLFGSIGQRSFGWLIIPLGVMLALLLIRPSWWSVIHAESIQTPTDTSRI